MQNHFHVDTGTKFGTAGGALATFLFNLQSADILKTLILATIGATVSFFVSLFLKWFLSYLKSKFKRPG
jgi:hypothetical protein